MYKLVYDLFTGKVCSIQQGNMSIPVCKDNADFQRFLIWNKEQKEPLDLNSTTEPVKPEPVRDLSKEIDEMKSQITTLTSKVSTLE